MPATAPSRLDPFPDAARTAEQHWRENHRALAARQPQLAAALDGCDPGVAWATARDGSVWAKDGDDHWLARCSVPLLAGRALLRTLAEEPGGQCLLSPAHAGLVVAARERIGPDAVLFVILPDLARCRTFLGCHDFADDLAAGRLWFAAGEEWTSALASALGDHPGLATPTRFIRTRLTADAEVEPLIAAAQRVFGEVATARAAQLERAFRDAPAIDEGRVLIIAGSRFRLWDDAGPTLATGVPAGTTVVRYDTDDPLVASPLSFVAAAGGCGAVVAANVGRGDAAAVVPIGLPWLTWLTVPHVPARASAGPRDELIMADPAWIAAARAAGWPAERVRFAASPPLVPAVAPPPGAGLALICDLPPIELPERVRSYSSHRVLWEAIAAELADSPLAVTVADAYLADRAGQFGIDVSQLDQAAFVTGLILPAYTSGIARLLLDGGLPLHLFGAGWDRHPALHAAAAGPVTSRGQLRSIVENHAALVRPAPGTGWHPVQACGRPVLSAHGRSASAWVRDARHALQRPAAIRADADGPALADVIASLLARKPVTS